MSFSVSGILQNQNAVFGKVSSGFTNFSNISKNSLSLNQSNSTSSSTSETSSTINAKREDIENRTSNSLLTSSIAISKRESITNSTLSAVGKLTSLNDEISNEIDPTRKASLISEAETILSDLNSYLTSEISNDSNLSSNVVVSSISPTDSDLSSSGSITSISIQGISSLSDLGISALDFTDNETTESALNSATLSLAQKLNSYSNSTTSVTSKVETEVAQFNLEAKELESTDKEQTLKDLNNSVSQSILNFTTATTTSADSILNLITDSDENENSDSNEEESEIISTSLTNLHTYESQTSELIPNEQNDSLNVEA